MSGIPEMSLVFIKGKNLYLRKVTTADASGRYLSWLNDPDVLRYRGQKAYPSNMADLVQFIEYAQSSKDLFLAVCLNHDDQHIGGISLTSLNFIHRTAELNIMIGEKSQWGKGLAREAISLLSRHAFMNMNLHKLWAESPNPGFNKVVSALGWDHEGTKKKMFMVDGGYVDVECYGLLKTDFREVA